MTRSVEIPDAGVEAVATACRESDFAWSSEGIHDEYWRKMARAALVAARPYLMPLLDREAIDRRLETAKGHGWSIETTVDAVMELARPMPTQEQIASVIHGSDHDSGGTRCPGSGACRHWYDAERAEERVLALLNGAES